MYVKPWEIIVAVLLALAAPAGQALDAWCPDDNPVIALSIGQATLQVEVANNRASRRCGLSNRSRLPDHAGMLFVFEQDAVLTFWMQDTAMPLSIAFLDNTGRIIGIQDMAKPRSKAKYHSPGAARYALETTLGWFQRHGIETGAYCRFTLPPTAPPGNP